MKTLLSFTFCVLIISGGIAYAQQEKSSTRKFIETAQITRTNRDWNVVAEFKSGYDEYVRFFPVEVTDLKTNKKIKALELNMFILEMKKQKFHKGYATVWVGLDEIDEFIIFIEKYVIPNLKLKFRKKSSEFIFRAKEMTLYYSVRERKRRLTIVANNYEFADPEDSSKSMKSTFWTETQVSKIPKLLEVLKQIK